MATANVQIKKILVGRGNATVTSAYPGVRGEVTMNTTTKTLHVHDGVTTGGWPLATEFYVANLLSEYGGVPGPQGPQGNIGAQGPTGATGSQGAQGIQGNVGPQGIQGNVGAQGAQGIQGNVGATGATGPQGIQGNTGATGSQGIQGNTGATGATGAQGIQGNVGATGSQGPQGAAGAKGDQGIQGIQGNTGAQGVSVTLRGNVSSPAALPVPGTAGDGYIVDSTGNLWFWNSTITAWADIGKIVGPEGPRGQQGIQGNTGAQGIQGIQGNVGATGPQGIQGNTGATGPQGIQGIQGNTGATGPQGIQGNVGATGAQGIQGIQGNTGAQGPQGIQGNVGPAGAQGAAGAQGIQGNVGPQGPQGAAGSSANTGDFTFTHSNLATTTGANIRLTTNSNTFVLSSTGNLLLPNNMSFISSPAVSGTGIVFGDGSYQYTAFTGTTTVANLDNNGSQVRLDSGGTLSVPNRIAPIANYGVAISPTNLSNTSLDWNFSAEGKVSKLYAPTSYNSVQSSIQFLGGGGNGQLGWDGSAGQTGLPYAESLFVSSSGNLNVVGTNVHIRGGRTGVFDLGNQYQLGSGGFSLGELSGFTFIGAQFTSYYFVQSAATDYFTTLLTNDCVIDAGSYQGSMAITPVTRTSFGMNTNNKYVFQIKVGRLSAIGNNIGVITESGDFTQGLGAANFDYSVGFESYGVYNGPPDYAGAPPFGVDDIVIVAVDRVNHKIWIKVLYNEGSDGESAWNSDPTADPTTNTGGFDLPTFGGAVIYPAVTSVNGNNYADLGWTFDNNGTLTLPTGAQLGNISGYAPGLSTGIFDSVAVSIGTGPGNDLTIGADSGAHMFAGGYEWTFGQDGNLQLPVGGDIVDSNGTSVLGGGAGGGSSDRLTNAEHSLILDSDGKVSFPGNLVIDNGVISNLNNIDDGALIVGSQIEVALERTLINNQVTNSLGEGGPFLQALSQIEVTANNVTIGSQVINSIGGDSSSLAVASLLQTTASNVVIGYATNNFLEGSAVTTVNLVEVNSGNVLIGQRVTNSLLGEVTLDAFTGWTFGTDGNMTLPLGSIIGETANTTVISPPGATAGQSLVIRPTAVQIITSDHPEGFADGDSITLTIQPNNGGAVTGTLDYTFTGATTEQLGLALTGTLTFTNQVYATLTWTVPAQSDIDSFTFTLGTPSGFSFGGPGNPYITLSRNGSSEDYHVHLVTGNPTTTDLYLGDDDQYVKIEKNGGNVVIGTDTNTKHWTFGSNGTLTIPGTINFTSSTAAITNVDTVTVLDHIRSPAYQFANGMNILSKSTIVGNVGGDADNGTLWFNTEDGRTYARAGGYWVDANPPVSPAPSFYTGNLEFSGTTIISDTRAWTFGTDGNLALPQGVAFIDTQFDPEHIGDYDNSVVVSNNGLSVEAVSVTPNTWLTTALLNTPILEGEKKMFSIYIDRMSNNRGGYNGIGIATHSATLTDYIGGDSATGAGFYEQGAYYGNTQGYGDPASYTTGDIIDVAVDNDNFRIWMRVNGGYWNNRSDADPTTNAYGYETGEYGTVYPGVTPYFENADIGNKFTLQTIPTFGVPPGFEFYGAELYESSYIKFGNNSLTVDHTGNLLVNGNLVTGSSGGSSGTDRGVIYTAPDIGGLVFANVGGAGYGSLTVVDGVMRATTTSSFTATVTSRNRLVLTNADSTLSAGNDIYLTANLETGAQSWRFGSNGSLGLPQLGQVTNNGQVWNFRNDGVLVTPSGIYVPSGDSSLGLTFSSDRTSSMGRISVDNSNNMTVNSTADYSVKVSSYDRVYISNNTTTVMAGQDLVLKSNKNATEQVWTFGANGNVTIAGNINFANGRNILSTISSIGNITVSGSDITGTGSNVTITADTTDYVFYANGTVRTDGALTIVVPSGTPAGVANWAGQGGWNQAFYSNLATTGGTGTGLTVDVAAGSGGYINIGTISINNPGSGYTDGDVITIDNENNLPGSFTVDVVSKNWTFGGNGATIFPAGGTITEANVGLADALILTPANVSYPGQQLRIYSTGGVVEGNHLHLTTGNLYTSELYLGDDNYFVKLNNNGNIQIRATTQSLSSTALWTFAADGRTTFPATAVPVHSYGALGDKAGMVVLDADYIYYCKSNFVGHTSSIVVNSDQWSNNVGAITSLPFLSTARAPEVGWTISINFNSGVTTLTITGVTSLGADRYQVDFNSVGSINVGNGNSGTLIDSTPVADIWVRTVWTDTNW